MVGRARRIATLATLVTGACLLAAWELLVSACTPKALVDEPPGEQAPGAEDTAPAGPATAAPTSVDTSAKAATTAPADTGQDAAAPPPGAGDAGAGKPTPTPTAKPTRTGWRDLPAE